jgi:ubiquinone/menaquinone biosynthesis C-methylase UbiE
MDKELEVKRYEERAKLGYQDHGLNSLLISPYEKYISIIKNFRNLELQVLEIAAGTGVWTKPLLESGNYVMATDLSAASIEVLKRRFKEFSRLEVSVQDMENLDFQPNCFDLVACAGGLSYGDNLRVMEEIYRVLKPGGSLVIVDSLNHNPIYRLNRFVHYLRGNRTKSTLRNMPTSKLMREYTNKFGSAEVYYFGVLSWLLLPLSKVVPVGWLRVISDGADAIKSLNNQAFKVVACFRKVDRGKDYER